MEPKVTVNETCKPPSLTTPPQCSTSVRVSSVFKGQVRSIPRKVGHAIQLGFDIDTLEILLHELDTVVDRFFIVEWTMPHNQLMNPKPLAWDAVKSRFSYALHKVVHIVMDDVDTAHIDSSTIFTVDNMQEQRRWEKILEWQNLTSFFVDTDLIGFGDTDETPSQQNVHLLKHCEQNNNDPVDMGIWFPMGRINQAYLTDLPVTNHPYSLGDLTFYLLAQPKQ